jgi:hypothetical protein
LELARLETRRELLRSQPHRSHARMADLDLCSLGAAPVQRDGKAASDANKA